MNSNTLFLILGYCLISVCFTVNARDTRGPSQSGPKGLDVAGSVPSVRGAVKPGVVAADVLDAADTQYGFSDKTLDAIVEIGKIPNVAGDPGVVIPKEETAESAKVEAEAQAKKAADEATKAAAAQKVTGEKLPLATAAKTKVEAAKKVAEEASKKAIEAETLEDAKKFAGETDVALKDAVAQGKEVDAAVKDVEGKTTEADTAAKAANAAAKIAKEKAEVADKLDLAVGKPTALLAKKAADEAEKSAKAAVASHTLASETAVKAKEAKTQSDKFIKEAEGHQEAADKAVEEKENDDPNKVFPAALNFVVDEKYEYFNQLLVADRCSDTDKATAGCKEFSNCYVDHTKPRCICFPGYYTEDASAAACVKIDNAVCEPNEKSCHRNANCVKDETKGLGCQCKAAFAGDGLLCSSAFSYFMNFFLVLAIVSVQLYM